jgi:aminoglycoside 6'-N-acetyltransferase
MDKTEPAITSTSFAFRRLERRDFPLMQRWLNTPHVLEWWDKPGPTLEQVEEKYLPRILGEEKTDDYVILENGREIGFIQTYIISDHPDYAAFVDVEEQAAGIDLFIGEPDRVHLGLGPRLLRAFMRTVVFARLDVESVIIGPAMSNASAIRAYEKAGFRYLKTIVVPDEDEPERLLRIWRSELMGSSDVASEASTS